jgi:ethanolamine utilization protein EutQ (cupin superfamily)
MRSAFKGLVVLCAAALLSASARADTPNFNKRGSTDKEEKEFVTDVAQTIVKEARSSAKDITLQEYKLKDGKEGRKVLTMSAGYKGALIKTKYSADIVVHLDASTKDSWKVLKIEYKDNNKSPISFSSKEVDALVKKFNSAARN